MSDGPTLRARPQAFPSDADGVEIFAFERRADGVRQGVLSYSDEAVDVSAETGAARVHDTVRLTRAKAQDLFDDLWKAGYRPSDRSNVEGVTGAQKAHIAFAETTVERLIGCLPRSSSTT